MGNKGGEKIPPLPSPGGSDLEGPVQLKRNELVVSFVGVGLDQNHGSRYVQAKPVFQEDGLGYIQGNLERGTDQDLGFQPQLGVLGTDG